VEADRQTDGRTDGGDCITSRANAVGNQSSLSISVRDEQTYRWLNTAAFGHRHAGTWRSRLACPPSAGLQ